MEVQALHQQPEIAGPHTVLHYHLSYAAASECLQVKHRQTVEGSNAVILFFQNGLHYLAKSWLDHQRWMTQTCEPFINLLLHSCNHMVQNFLALHVSLCVIMHLEQFDKHIWVSQTDVHIFMTTQSLRQATGILKT